MKNWQRLLGCLLVFFIPLHGILAQSEMPTSPLDSTFTFTEFLGYVKEHHPVVGQANLKLTIAEGQLLKARGAFDPKIEVDYDRKKFKSTEYYDVLNSSFKIPTWFGLEFKATFEESSGEFLDPSLTLPDGGLYGAGVSLDVAQGLLTNDRMATLRKSKFFLQRTQGERELQLNEILYDAAMAYLEWYEAYSTSLIYADFLENAQIRLQGVISRSEAGDLASIDVTEARIAVRNRELAATKASLKSIKARLKASTFLWVENTPAELQEYMVPVLPDFETFKSSLILLGDTDMEVWMENHPKLRSIDFKLKEQEIERRLATNKLLPRIRLNYNFLNTDYDNFSQFNTDNYKAGVEFSFPLFLRKERGELKMAKAKLADIELERLNTTLNLQTDLESVLIETVNLEEQLEIVVQMVEDYRTMLKAEERKLQLGASSLFLVNTREQRLIDGLLKNLETQTEYLASIAKLFKVRGQALIPN